MREIAVLTMPDSGFEVKDWGHWFARKFAENGAGKGSIRIDTFNGQGYSAVRFTFPSEQTADSFVFPISRALSEWVISEAEPRWIRMLIRRECGRVEEEQLRKIEAYCQAILAADGDVSRDGKQAVKEEMALLFADGFRNHPFIVVEGVVRFRMKRYMKHLQTAVVHAVEEFIMEEQYREFLSMLRCYVFAQEAKVPVAHVLHREGRFQILDAQLNPLDPEIYPFFKETGPEEILEEDMIVSRLLTLLPQKIYIHTEFPELKVIHTIRHIFSDRAVVCPGSSLLHSPACPQLH